MSSNPIPVPRAKPHAKRHWTVGAVVEQILLLLMAVFVLYPLFFVLLTSFKTNSDVILNPFGISTFEPQNYITAWFTGKVGSYLLNSVITTLVTLVIQVVIIVLAAYAFGKLKPWGYNALLSLLLMTMFVTSEMTTVPNYITIRDMGLMGTRWSLIIPYVASGLITGTYILTNFVRELPKELDEAARIDGAGSFQIFLRIICPSIKPVLMIVALGAFQGAWNDYYWPSIVMTDPKNQTLTSGLAQLQNQLGTSQFASMLASTVISMILPFVLYLVCQKYFLQGIKIQAAVKG